MLCISYKTAWYLCHRIRKAMEEASSIDLTGTVELDESYIGGKRRHVGSGNLDNKTMMLGALARGGEVRLRVEKRQKAGIADEDTMHDTANHHVEASCFNCHKQDYEIAYADHFTKARQSSV